MERRKQIMHFVLEKKPLEATEQLAQGFLEKNKDAHFHLLCLHFLELLSAAKCALSLFINWFLTCVQREALEFARTRLAPFGNVPEYVEKLQAIMGLLTCDYENPELSHILHLLSSEYCQRVARKLNRAILEHANQPRYTPMERLVQQVTVARRYLTEEYGKDAFPPFSLKDSLKGETSQDRLQRLLGE